MRAWAHEVLGLGLGLGSGLGLGLAHLGASARRAAGRTGWAS